LGKEESEKGGRGEESVEGLEGGIKKTRNTTRII